MNKNKIFNKYVSSSFVSLAAWAVLTGAACAEPTEEGEVTGAAATAVPAAQPVAEGAKEFTLFGGMIDADIFIYFLTILVIALILLVAYCLNQYVKLEEKIKKLKKDLNDLSNREKGKPLCIADITSEITSKRRENKDTIDDVYKATSRNKDIEKVPDIDKNIQAKEEKPPVSENKTNEWIHKFIKGYNSFADDTFGNDYARRREATKKFKEFFHIKYFSCENYEERLTNPALNMVFKTLNRDDIYWATHLEKNLYAVAPRLSLTYESQVHETAGMKEVFASNFAGNTYNKIILKKPAVFEYVNDTWELKERGELELR